MFTRKYFAPILSLFLLFSFQVNAQMDQSELDDPATSDLENFVNKFENWNVGNLHVYTKPEGTYDVDYYFKGESLSREDQPFLPYNLQTQLLDDQNYVYAVGSIRHTGDNNFGENDIFLIRTNAKNSPDQIALYEMENDQLKFRKVLAYHKKVWGGHLQMNSWIQDVNGDTRLDIIQKGRKLKKNGKVKKEKTKVFLLQDDGSYTEASNELINTDDYQLEDLK